MKKFIYLSICLIASTANAGLVSYTDRASFDAVAGTTSIENFESFVNQTPFHSTTVNLVDFSISMQGTPSTSYNFIDIAPAQTAESDVNGSNHMRVFTDDSPFSSLTLTFDSAITAFGADFRSLNDTINRTRLLIGSDILSIPVAGSGGQFSFFGFTSDTAFTSIVFEGLANDVYGIDNVTYTATSVPEPTTIALLALGVAGIGFSRRRNKA